MEKSRLPLFRKKNKSGGGSNSSNNTNSKQKETSNSNVTTTRSNSKHNDAQGLYAQPVAASNKGNKGGKKDKSHNVTKTDSVAIGAEKPGTKSGAAIVDASSTKWPYKRQLSGPRPDVSHEGDGKAGSVHVRTRHNSKDSIRQERNVQGLYYANTAVHNEGQMPTSQGNSSSRGIGGCNVQMAGESQTEQREYGRAVEDRAMGTSSFNYGLNSMHKSSLPQVADSSRDGYSLGSFSGSSRDSIQSNLMSPNTVTMGDNAATPTAASTSYLDQFRKYYEYDVTGRRSADTEESCSKSPSDPDSSPHHDYEDIDLIMSAGQNRQFAPVSTTRDITQGREFSQQRFNHTGGLPRSQGVCNRGPLPPPPVPPHSSAYHHHVGAGNLQPTSYLNHNKTSPLAHSTSGDPAGHTSNRSVNQQPLARTHINQSDLVDRNQYSFSSKAPQRNASPQLGVYKHSASVEGFGQGRGSLGQRTSTTGPQLSGSQSGNALVNCVPRGGEVKSHRRDDYQPLMATTGEAVHSSHRPIISGNVQTAHFTPNQRQPGNERYSAGQRVNMPRTSDNTNEGRLQSHSGYQTYQSMCEGYQNHVPVPAPVNQTLPEEGHVQGGSIAEHLLALRSHYQVPEESTPPDSPLDIVIPPPGASGIYFNGKHSQQFSRFPYSTNNQTSNREPPTAQNRVNENVGNNALLNYTSNRETAQVPMKDMVTTYNERNGDRMYDQVPPMDYDSKNNYETQSPAYEYSTSVISPYLKDDPLLTGSIPGDRAPSYGYIYNTEIHPLQVLSEKNLQAQYYQEKYSGGNAIYSTKMDGNARVSPPYTPVLSGVQPSSGPASQNSPRVVMQGVYSLYNSPSGGERPLVAQSPLFGRKHSFPSPSCGIRMAEMRARAQRRWSDPKSPNYAALANDRNTPSPTSSTSSVHSYQSAVVDMSTIREEDGCRGDKKTMDTSPRSSKQAGGGSRGYERLNPEQIKGPGCSTEKQGETPTSPDSQQCASAKTPRRRYPSEPSTKKDSITSGTASSFQNARHYDSLQCVNATVSASHSYEGRLGGSHHNNSNEGSKMCTEGLLTSDPSPTAAHHQNSLPTPHKAGKASTNLAPEAKTVVTRCSQAGNGGRSEDTTNPGNGGITQPFSNESVVNKDIDTSNKGEEESALVGNINSSPSDPYNEEQAELVTRGMQICDTVGRGDAETWGTAETVTPPHLSESVSSGSVSVTTKEDRASSEFEPNMVISSVKLSEKSMNLSPQRSRAVSSPQASNTNHKCSTVYQTNDEIKRKSDGFCGKASKAGSVKSNVSKLRPPSTGVVNRQGGGGVKTDQSSGKNALRSPPSKEKSLNHHRPLAGGITTARKGEGTNPAQTHTSVGLNNKESSSPVKGTQEQPKSSKGNTSKSINKPVDGLSKLRFVGQKVRQHTKGEGTKTEYRSKPTGNIGQKDSCPVSTGTDPHMPLELPSQQKNSAAQCLGYNAVEIHDQQETFLPERAKSSTLEDQPLKSPLKSPTTESDDCSAIVTRGNKSRLFLGKSHRRAASYSSISSCDPMSSLPSSPCSSQLSIDSISSDTFEYDLPDAISKTASSFVQKFQHIATGTATSESESTSEQSNLRDNSSNQSLSDGSHSNKGVRSDTPMKAASKYSNTDSGSFLHKEVSAQAACDSSESNTHRTESPCLRETTGKVDSKRSERRGSLSAIPTGSGSRGTSSKVAKGMSSSTSSESNISSSSMSGIAVRVSDNERNCNSTVNKQRNPGSSKLKSPSPSHQASPAKGSRLKKPTVNVKPGINARSNKEGAPEKNTAVKEGTPVKSQSQSPAMGNERRRNSAASKDKRSNSAMRNDSRSNSRNRRGASGVDSAEDGRTTSLATFSRSNSSESSASAKSSVKEDISPASSPGGDFNKMTSIPSPVGGFGKSAEIASRMRAPKPSKLMKPTSRDLMASKEQSGASRLAKSVMPNQASSTKHKVNSTSKTANATVPPQGNGPCDTESKDNASRKAAGGVNRADSGQRNKNNGKPCPQQEKIGEIQVDCDIRDNMCHSPMENGKGQSNTMETAGQNSIETQTMAGEPAGELTNEITETAITGKECLGQVKLSENSKPLGVSVRKSSPGAQKTTSAENPKLHPNNKSGNPRQPPSSSNLVIDTHRVNAEHQNNAGPGSGDCCLTQDGSTSNASGLSSRARTLEIDDRTDAVIIQRENRYSANTSTVTASRETQSTEEQHSRVGANIRSELDTDNPFSQGLLPPEDGNLLLCGGRRSVTSGVSDSDNNTASAGSPCEERLSGRLTGQKWEDYSDSKSDLRRKDAAPFCHNSGLMEGNHAALSRRDTDSGPGGNEVVSNNGTELGNETCIKDSVNKFQMAPEKGQVSFNEHRATLSGTQHSLIGPPGHWNESKDRQEKISENVKETTVNSSQWLKPKHPAVAHPFLVKPYASLRKNKSPDMTMNRGQSSPLVRASLSSHTHENEHYKDIKKMKNEVETTVNTEGERDDIVNSGDKLQWSHDQPEWSHDSISKNEAAKTSCYDTSREKNTEQYPTYCVNSPTNQLGPGLSVSSLQNSDNSQLVNTLDSPGSEWTVNNSHQDREHQHPAATTGSVSMASPGAPAHQYTGSMTTGSSLGGPGERRENDPATWQTGQMSGSQSGSVGTQSETVLCPKDAEPPLPRCQLAEKHDPERNASQEISPLPSRKQIGSINGQAGGLGCVSITCDSNGDKVEPRAGNEEPQCIQGAMGGTEGRLDQSRNWRNSTADGEFAGNVAEKSNEIQCTDRGKKTKDQSSGYTQASKSVIATDTGTPDALERSGQMSHQPFSIRQAGKVHKNRPEAENKGHTQTCASVVSTNNNESVKDSPHFSTENANRNLTLESSHAENLISSRELASPGNCTSSKNPDPVATGGLKGREEGSSPPRQNITADEQSAAINGVQASKARFRGLRSCHSVAPELTPPRTTAEKISKDDSSDPTGGWIRTDSNMTKKSEPSSSQKAAAVSLANRQICKKALSKIGKYNKIHISAGGGCEAALVNSKDSLASVISDKSPNLGLNVSSSVQKHNAEPLRRVILSNSDDLLDERQVGDNECINDTTDTSTHFSGFVPEQSPTPQEELNNLTHHDKLSPVAAHFHGNQNAQIVQYDSYFVLNDESQNSRRYMTLPSEPYSPRRRKTSQSKTSHNEPFEMRDHYIEDSYFGDPSFTPNNNNDGFCPTVIDPESTRERLNGENMLNSLKLSESGYDSWKSQGSSSTACEHDPDSENEVKGEAHPMENLGQVEEEEDGSLSSSDDTESINGTSTDSVVTMKTVRECCSETNSGSNDDDIGKISLVTTNECLKVKQICQKHSLTVLEKSKLSASRSSSESTLTSDAIKYLEWDASYDNSLLANNKDMSSIEDLLESAELFSKGREISDSIEHLLFDYEDCSLSDHNFDSGSMKKRLNFSGSDFALALHSMSKSPSEENVLEDCHSAAALLLQQGKNTLGSSSQGYCLHNSKLALNLPTPWTAREDNNGKISSPGQNQAALSSPASGAEVTAEHCGSVNDTGEDFLKTSGCQERECFGHNETDSTAVKEVAAAVSTKWGSSTQDTGSQADWPTESMENGEKSSPVGDKDSSLQQQNYLHSCNFQSITVHPSSSRRSGGNPHSQRCETGGDQSVSVEGEEEEWRRPGEVLIMGGNVHEASSTGNYSGEADLAPLMARDLGRAAGYLTPGQLDDCGKVNTSDNCGRELETNQLTSAGNEKLFKHAEVVMDSKVKENKSDVDKPEINTPSEASDSKQQKAGQRSGGTSLKRSTAFRHSNVLNKQESPHCSNSNIKAKAALFESGVSFLSERRKQLFHSRHGDQYSPSNRNSSSSSHSSSSRPYTETGTTGAHQMYIAVKNSEDRPSLETQLSPGESRNGGAIESSLSMQTQRQSGTANSRSGENVVGNKRFSAGLLNYREKLLKDKVVSQNVAKSRSKSHGDEPLGEQTPLHCDRVQSQRSRLGQVNENEVSSVDLTSTESNSRNSGHGGSSQGNSMGMAGVSTERPMSLNIPPKSARFSSGSSDLTIATVLFMEVTPPEEDVFEESNNTQTCDQREPASGLSSSQTDASSPIQYSTAPIRQLSHEEYLKTRRPARQPSQDLSPAYSPHSRASVSPASGQNPSPTFELQNGTLVLRNRSYHGTSDNRGSSGGESGIEEVSPRQEAGTSTQGQEKVAREGDYPVDQRQDGNQAISEYDPSGNQSSNSSAEPDSHLPAHQSTETAASRFTTSQIPWGQKRGSGAKVMEKLKLFQGRRSSSGSPEGHTSSKFSWSQLKLRKNKQ